MTAWIAFRATGLLAAMLFLAGCGHDVSVNTPGDPSTAPPGSGNGDTTGGSGTVQRASLHVVVVVAPEDAGLAAAIGSPGGVLRGAFVTVERSGGGQARASDTTGADGSASLASLLPGSYTVSVARTLTPEETAVFGATDQDVNAFGGGAVVTVRAPTTSLEVEVAAGRRGSLVISEVFTAEPLHSGGIGFYYYFGHFIELFNNADTVIPLAGKLIGRGMPLWRNYSPPNTCEGTEVWRNDPEGIWTRHMDRFPPGRTLSPGETVLIATDAIDHSAVVSDMQSLTHANYESIGSNDVDNPGVPNMIRAGFAEWFPPLGHGLMFSVAVTFVAESLDVGSLTTGNLPLADPQYVRVPRAKLLDVFTTGETPEREAQHQRGGFPLCPEIVHANIDRQYANLEDTLDPHRSMRRRVFTTLPDGRRILLRTRSSRNDFEVAQPTPGFVQ